MLSHCYLRPRLKANSIASAMISELNVRKEPSKYSQRRIVPSTPSPDLNPLLSLAHPIYGLPESLVSNMASMGVRSIYPWQSPCLLGKGVLAGTIEKANSLVNATVEDGKSNQHGIVVMDEFHVLDENRRYLTELTITRLLCCNRESSLLE